MGPGGEVRLQVKRVEPAPAWGPGGIVVGDFLAEVSSSAIKLAEAAPYHTLSKSSDGSG